MWSKSDFYLTLFFYLFIIFLTFSQILSLIKKIYIMKKSIKNSSAFCSIIQFNKNELTHSIVSLILLILFILLFFYSEHIMEKFSSTGFLPINYQAYYLLIHIGKPVIYSITLISSIITIINNLFPTIITDNYIKVNCSRKYNKKDVLFKIENDTIIIYSKDTKDTILYIEKCRKKKTEIWEILKIYYTEERNYQE